MAGSWLNRKVRLGPIGSERETATRGFPVTARLDTAAEMTCISPTLARHIYGTDQIPVVGTIKVKTLGTTQEVPQVPLVIALGSGRGRASIISGPLCADTI